MKKILAVVDKLNWALDIEMTGLKKHLPKDCGFSIDVMSTHQLFKRDKNQVLEEYDLIYPTAHEVIGQALIRKNYPKSRMCTTVMCHRCWDDGKSRPGKNVLPPDKFVEELKGYRKLGTNSATISKLFAEKGLNLLFVHTGTDPDLFLPLPKSRRSNKLVVGWVGNPTYLGKGYYDYVVPVCEKLLDIVELYPALARHETYRRHDEMKFYYREIDVLTIMADSEGAPNPLKEAMFCGRPVISTDIGLVSMYINHGENGFITEQSHVALEKYLLKYAADRKMCYEHGLNAAKSVQQYTWDKLVHVWVEFFESAFRGDGLIENA